MIKRLYATDLNYNWAKSLHAPINELYVAGDLGLLNNSVTRVAIVGTRKPTQYGLNCLKLIIPPLVRSGIVIVSGGAFGVDIEALKIANALGGSTITVFASSLCNLTPRGNLPVFNNLNLEKNLLVSEFNQEHTPKKFSFAQRNRIISALSDLVLIIEAGEKSGALITADFANEQGKFVAAIPGPITAEQSQGTNSLIKSGAYLITNSNDILSLVGKQELPLLFDKPESPIPSSFSTTLAILSNSFSSNQK